VFINIVLATAWLIERTTLIRSNPLNQVSDTLIAHPLVVAGVLAAAATVGWALPGLHDRCRAAARGGASPD
jgi:hypothetical protein